MERKGERDRDIVGEGREGTEGEERERRPPIHISAYATEKWPVQSENRDDVPGGA